ncbi:MAG: hypothetical protein V9F03_06455 [Microthrixaceae bacterium]
MDLCAGDIGNSAARTFDIEVYAPGADKWLEVSSVSWFSDYQARRANLRYRSSDGKGTTILHTLNGSALAVPRVWAAIVETYQAARWSYSHPRVATALYARRDRDHCSLNRGVLIRRTLIRRNQIRRTVR